MSWLFPGFLAGALALALPIALHLLRRWPRRPIVFPATRFLVPAMRRTQTRTQRLRRWLVLAFRCAALALLAAAFARPFRGGDANRGSRATVVVVDNSFSLQAGDRWPALRAWALRQIETLGVGDRLGVVTMAPQPTWVVPPTTDIDRARAALVALSPGWLGAHIEPALRMAAEAVAAIPADRREIVVLTDHQRVSWLGTDFARKLSPGVRLAFPEMPAPVRVQAALLSPKVATAGERLRASVSIRNFTERQTRVLRVYRDGAAQPEHEETLTLGAHELRHVPLDLPGTSGKPAQFRFTLDADDLPADDTAYAVWQPREEGLILLDPAPAGTANAPTATADFVAQALSVISDLKPVFKVAPMPVGEWPIRAVAVLRNDASFTGPAADRLNAFLAGGGAAAIFVDRGAAATAWLAARNVALTPLAAQSEPWRVHDWRLDHPLVAALGRHRLGVLLNWDFREGWALSVNSVDTLAYWADAQAAIGELRLGSGRVLICGFGPDRRTSDWPATPAFVQFLHQAAAYLFTAQQAAIVSGQAGDTFALAGSGRWQAKDGPNRGTAAVEVSGSVVPLAPGIYEFTHGSERTLFAVNLPPEESDLTPWEAGAPWTMLVGAIDADNKPAKRIANAGGRTRAAELDAEQRAPLWWWAVAAVAALLLAEMALANRTAR